MKVLAAMCRRGRTEGLTGLGGRKSRQRRADKTKRNSRWQWGGRKSYRQRRMDEERKSGQRWAGEQESIGNDGRLKENSDEQMKKKWRHRWTDEERILTWTKRNKCRQRRTDGHEEKHVDADGQRGEKRRKSAELR